MAEREGFLPVLTQLEHYEDAMTSTSTCRLTICIDHQLKDDATRLFESLGMSLNTAISVFLHQAAREGGLPFQPEPVTLDQLKVLENHHSPASEE